MKNDIGHFESCVSVCHGEPSCRQSSVAKDEGCVSQVSSSFESFLMMLVLKLFPVCFRRLLAFLNNKNVIFLRTSGLFQIGGSRCNVAGGLSLGCYNDCQQWMKCMLPAVRDCPCLLLGQVLSPRAVSLNFLDYSDHCYTFGM